MQKLPEHPLDLLRLEDTLPTEHRMMSRALRDYLTHELLPHVCDWDRQERTLTGEVLRDMMTTTEACPTTIEGTWGGKEFTTSDYLMKGVVMREIERVDSGLRSACSVQQSLVMMPIYWYGTDEQKHRWLRPLSEFTAVGCYGQTEPGAGSDPASMRTRARRDGDDWIISGEKCWITNAPIADVAIVWAKNDAGLIQGFLVDMHLPGITVKKESKWALRLSSTGHINFADVRVPDSARLPKAVGLTSAFRCLNEARFGIAWGLVGASEAIFEEALGYASGRKQFDRPIASFGHQRKRIAEMAQNLTAMQCFAHRVAILADLHGSLTDLHVRTMVAMAKGHNSVKGREIAEHGKRLLGANHCSFDYHTPRHARNFEVVWTYEGTGDIHELILSEYLTGIPAFNN